MLGHRRRIRFFPTFPDVFFLCVKKKPRKVVFGPFSDCRKWQHFGCSEIFCEKKGKKS
jgi:hypothetical protein